MIILLTGGDLGLSKAVFCLSRNREKPFDAWFKVAWAKCKSSQTKSPEKFM